MKVEIEFQLIEALNDTLREAQQTIQQVREEKKQVQAQLDRNRLLTEAEAVAYLNRDPVTLRFYRKAGLPYIKKGRDVWYVKGDIDDWLSSGKVNRHTR